MRSSIIIKVAAGFYGFTYNPEKSNHAEAVLRMALGLSLARTLQVYTLFLLFELALGIHESASPYKKAIFVGLAAFALVTVLWRVYGTDQGNESGRFYQASDSKARHSCVWLAILYLVASIATFFFVAATLG